MTTADFVRFKLRREKYDREVAEKAKSQVSVSNLHITSITEGLLEMLVEYDFIEKDSVADVTEDDIKECIEKNIKRSLTTMDMSAIDQLVAPVRMNMNLQEAVPRIYKLVYNYKRVLEEAGYKEFTVSCPRAAIEHIFEKIKPSTLKRMMENECMKQEKDGLRKENFVKFVKELVRLAEVLEQAGPLSQPNDQNLNKHTKTVGNRSGQKRRRQDHESPSNQVTGSSGNQTNTGGSSGKSVDPQSTKSKRQKPQCLNPKCDKRHYIGECELTDMALREKMLTEYRANKKNKPDGKIGKVCDMDLENHSMLFSAKFTGAVEATVMADNGADDNLMPMTILKQIISSSPLLPVTSLKRPLRYSMAVDTPTHNGVHMFTCHKTVVADVELRIRHGTTLMLRKVTWPVCEQEAEHVLIARPLLEALGLDTKAVLEAASDKQNGIVNVPDILPMRALKPGKIAKLMRDAGVFHSKGGSECESLDDEDLYIDLGEDDDAEVRNSLEASVRTAKEKVLSDEGAAELQSLLSDFCPIFRIRLGKSPPAQLKPMKITLKPNSRPVRVKARHYPPKQRTFLVKYVNELERMGFIRSNPAAEWVHAPLLVPKPNSKASFRLTVNLRPVNAARVKQIWPMPMSTRKFLTSVQVVGKSPPWPGRRHGRVVERASPNRVGRLTQRDARNGKRKH